MNATPEVFSSLLETMTSSVSTARSALQSFRSKEGDLEMTQGISLLSLKDHILLSYIRSLTVLSPHRVIGRSLTERSPPMQSFSHRTRDGRGFQAGDLLDSLLENRLLLEKMDVLESKMKYQIEKLIRLVEEPVERQEISEDPLAFRPNPASFVQSSPSVDRGTGQSASFAGEILSTGEGDGIYHPPRLAPMPYNEQSKTHTRRNRAPVPSALAALSLDPSGPLLESTSGLGAIPALSSGRAQYLKRLKDYEEENFTRVILKKKDAKRRSQDEEDVALGADLGTGFTSGRRQRAGGLEDEFGTVLRSVSRVTASGRNQGDGYEELRQKGKKSQALERSRAGTKKRDNPDTAVEEKPPRKRSRFEMEIKFAKKKLRKSL